MTDTTLSSSAETREHGVGLTAAASDKVKSLLSQEGRDDLRLRVAVQPAAAPASSTSCTSTSVTSTVTRSSTSTASR